MPSDLKKRFRVVEAGRARGPRHHRDAASLGDRARLHLVAEQFEDFRARSDEDDSLFVASARERRVLAQEAVAGMDGVASGFLGDCDDAFGIEIRFRADAA